MTIKRYLLNNINASYICDLRNNVTICSLRGWLEKVGVESMTDATMQTMVDVEDIEGWSLDFIDVYEDVLGRKLTSTEVDSVIKTYYWHKDATSNKSEH